MNQHKNQVKIEISGDNAYAIREQLLNIVRDIDMHGKPIQRNVVICGGGNAEVKVLTPVWGGSKY